MALDFFIPSGLPAFGEHGLHVILYAALTVVILCLTADRLRLRRARPRDRGAAAANAGQLRKPIVDANREASKLLSTSANDDGSASEDESQVAANVAAEMERMEHVPFEWRRRTDEEMARRAEEFYAFVNTRRTLRMFSCEPVPRTVIDNIIRASGTSPSGAHKQPWTYVVISDSNVKSQLRVIIEAEEEVNYRRRMGDRWVTTLRPFKTNWVKPYIEDAPYIVLVFKRVYEIGNDGTKHVNYYSELSVAISVGIFLMAVHNAGLHTLTSTPLNCGPAVSSLLGRPSNEKLLFLLPIGFPHDECTVPNLTRKPLDNIAVYI